MWTQWGVNHTQNGQGLDHVHFNADPNPRELLLSCRSKSGNFRQLQPNSDPQPRWNLYRVLFPWTSRSEIYTLPFSTINAFRTTSCNITPRGKERGWPGAGSSCSRWRPGSWVPRNRCAFYCPTIRRGARLRLLLLQIWHCRPEKREKEKFKTFSS